LKILAGLDQWKIGDGIESNFFEMAGGEAAVACGRNHGGIIRG